jgi:hypothetical protein
MGPAVRLEWLGGMIEKTRASIMPSKAEWHSSRHYPEASIHMPSFLLSLAALDVLLRLEQGARDSCQVLSGRSIGKLPMYVGGSAGDLLRAVNM